MGTNTHENKITESAKLEKPCEPNCSPSTAEPTTKPHPKCQVYIAFKSHQGWGLQHCSGQPVSQLYNTFREIFPNI